MKPKYDILWKGMVEEIMEDLLLFVEPEIGKELDLGGGFEYLDKELAALYPQPDRPANTKVVDKLVKVFLRNGTERWMLLHIEIQGKKEKDFARRMFEYYIRVLSKHGRPVAALAVLTGKEGKSVPTAFEDRYLWMRARYDYKTLCITDFPDETLRASMNPFAVVIMIAKEVLLRIKGTEEELDTLLLEHKLQMVRLIKERMAVFGEKKTDAMLLFLHNYIVFKKQKTNLNFMGQTDQILGKTNTMGILEQLAEIRRQEGLEEGRQQGLEEGMEKGMEKGKEESVRLLLLNTEFSADKVAALVGVPIAVVRKIKKEVGRK